MFSLDVFIAVLSLLLISLFEMYFLLVRPEKAYKDLDLDLDLEAKIGKKDFNNHMVQYLRELIIEDRPVRGNDGAQGYQIGTFFTQ